MNLEFDAQGNVIKINELVFSGKKYTITFINGTSHYIRDIGYVTQQLNHIPFLVCSLAEALQFSYEISRALGEGPVESGTNHVKLISTKINNRFSLNFLDKNIQLFDLIEFFNDNVRYINEAGPQLSELGDLSHFYPQIMTERITIALVAPSDPAPSILSMTLDN